MFEPQSCPWCGGHAIDVTLHGDPRRHYFCARDPKHEWAEGQEPLKEPEPEGLELSEVAEAIATAVVRKIEKPSLKQRVFELFGK